MGCKNTIENHEQYKRVMGLTCACGGNHFVCVRCYTTTPSVSKWESILRGPFCQLAKSRNAIIVDSRIVEKPKSSRVDPRTVHNSIGSSGMNIQPSEGYATPIPSFSARIMKDSSINQNITTLSPYSEEGLGSSLLPYTRSGGYVTVEDMKRQNLSAPKPPPIDQFQLNSR